LCAGCAWGTVSEREQTGSLVWAERAPQRGADPLNLIRVMPAEGEVRNLKSNRPRRSRKNVEMPFRVLAS
jgi:hypothetical protein